MGDDEAGRALIQIFRKNKISVSGISRLKGHSTTTKTRILAYSSHSSRQQVVRIDRECEPLPDTHPALVELVASAREYAPAADAVLLSDYGYGAVSPRLFNFVRAKGALGDTPVTLDSRYRMLDYEGVTAATPNESEVEEALRLKIGDDRAKLFEAGCRPHPPDEARVAGHHPRQRRHGGLREEKRSRRWRFPSTATARWWTSPAPATPSSPPSPPPSPPEPTPPAPPASPTTPAASSS